MRDASEEGSDIYSETDTDDTRNTEDLAEQNQTNLDTLAEYKHNLGNLRGLRGMVEKEQEDHTDEEIAAWEAVAGANNCDLSKEERTSGELEREITDTKVGISRLKQDLADNHYGSEISDSDDSNYDSNLSDIETDDELILPFLSPSISILFMLYKIKVHPAYKFYLIYYKNIIISKWNNK